MSRAPQRAAKNDRTTNRSAVRYVGQRYFSAVEHWLYPGEHAVTMISLRPLCPAGDAAAVSGAGDCANAGDGAAGAAVINNANLGVEITRMIIPSFMNITI